MEFSDVIYLILMIGFVVFGIFNDSKKKKSKTGTITPPINPYALEEGDRETQKKVDAPPVVLRKKPILSTKQKPTSKKLTSKNDSSEFQSSIDLVTDFEAESSLKDFKKRMSLMKEVSEPYEFPTEHPLLEDLANQDKTIEMKKAIIYSEILKRKY